MRQFRHDGTPRIMILLGSAAAALAAGLLLGGCEVAEPKLPTFTTQLALPIGDDRLDVLDLVNDEDYLVALEDGSLGFTVSGDPDTIALDFDLGADLPAQSLASTLGTFAIDPVSPDPFAFPLADLAPAAAALDGMTTPVPAFAFGLTGYPSPIPDVTSATVASGSLQVTITNGLPVPVSGPLAASLLQFRLFDPDNAATIAVIDFPDEVPAGATVSGSADLAGVVLGANIAVELQGASAGSATPVLVDAASEVMVAASFVDLVVSAAVAPVPAQTFTTDLLIDLPADYAVLAAGIASGSLTADLRNDLAIPCRVQVIWADVYAPSGGNLVAALDLAPGAGGSLPMDFAGCTITAGGAPLSALTAHVLVTSPGSSGASVPVDAAQSISLDIAPGRVEFAEVTGEVPAIEFAIDPVQESIDLPSELAGVSLNAATLSLLVTNTSGVNAEADLLLSGTSEDGVTVSMPLQETLVGTGEPTRGVTEILRDETNSTIVAFLNNLPTAITLEGTVVAGGSGQVGTVRPGDRATLGWSITAPVEITVDGSVIEGDPEALDFDADTRDLIRDRAGAARLLLEIGNRLPVAVQARVLFSADTTSITTAPLLAVGPVAIAAGVVDPVTHTALAVATSTPTIELTALETKLLATEGLYAVIEVTLPGTGGAPARIMTDDYLTFRGLVQLDVEVSE